MTEGKRLYRSRDALVGGVCAGVADYFNVDPVIVRILAVVFTLASGGLLGVAYVAMWLVVPKKPKAVGPLDVEPQAVHSETYGPVDADVARGRTDAGGPRVASPAQAASWRYTATPYTTAAHVPPPPPAAARPAYEAWSPAAQPAPPHVEQPPKEPSPRSVRAALWAGSLLLFFGVAAMVANFVEGVSWWQSWPVIFVILGIVRMVVPGEPGRRMRGFVDGLVCFFAGGALLSMSLGIVAWQSLELMFATLWPLLLMMLGLLTLGGALKSPTLTLLGGLCFVAFCVVGLVWYSMPGSTAEIVFSAPYGRDYHLYIQRWLG